MDGRSSGGTVNGRLRVSRRSAGFSRRPAHCSSRRWSPTCRPPTRAWRSQVTRCNTHHTGTDRSCTERHTRRLAASTSTICRSLDRDRLAALAAAAETEIIVLALAGASDLLTTHLLNALPRPQSEQIRHELSQLGPIRLSDVEAAQQELTHLAMTLDTHDRPGRSTLTTTVAA